MTLPITVRFHRLWAEWNEIAEYLGCMADDSVCRNSGGGKGVEGAEEKKTRINVPWPRPWV